MFVRQSTHEAALAAKDAAHALTVSIVEVELASEREHIKLLQDLIDSQHAELASLRESAYGADRTAAMYKRLYEGTCKALGDIAGQETPTANATVKRMARIARGGLPVLHHDAGFQREAA